MAVLTCSWQSQKSEAAPNTCSIQNKSGAATMVQATGAGGEKKVETESTFKQMQPNVMLL